MKQGSLTTGVKYEKLTTTKARTRLNTGKVTSLETTAAEELGSVSTSNHCFHRRNQHLAGFSVFNCYIISTIIRVYTNIPGDVPQHYVALHLFLKVCYAGFCVIGWKLHNAA